jgi:hypothetical protein
MSRWRNAARPIIAQVLADNAGADERAIRKALRAAYPFGSYSMHPLKIWRSEIVFQLNGTLAHLQDCIPPGFPPESIRTAQGRAIAADWWIENGNDAKASRLLKPVKEPKKKRLLRGEKRVPPAQAGQGSLFGAAQ